MKTTDFDYKLPSDRIAQTPEEPRDHSRLLILDRAAGKLEHRHFFDLPDYLTEQDTLVFNDSRVIPARLFGFKAGTTTKIELLLLRRIENDIWECLVKPGRKVVQGTRVLFDQPDSNNGNDLEANVVEVSKNGVWLVRFSDEKLLNHFGKVPLPPYIHTPLKEAERYQTVYARISGSAAAPTAGLHFTPELLDKLQLKGVEFAFVTLHIGLDTFQPVRTENPESHRIHTEYGILSPETAVYLNESKKRGRRIIAVGTSTVRIIEHASAGGTVRPLNENLDLFILPGYQFKITDAIITNFHTPKSTLLMLVSAFAGREKILGCYREAIDRDYRFFSFGDAMMIV
jgi:S-adenosylmethionine:tRNA ribosyltransferase-isomerase